ncbi:hypothetical protein PZS87_27660, partial [Klebsiella pneumoniae]|nr:hypothetical protein [Klebsiella pneumoniae]
GKNSLNRLIRCVCGKKIGPDPRNFNQRVSLGRNDLLIRTFPKAWIMATGAITTYLPQGENVRSVIFLSILFASINAPSVSIWVTFGATLRHWLNDIKYLRIFNVCMAMLLLASLYPLLFL